MSPQTSQTFLRFRRRASRIIINCRRKIQFQPIHSNLSKRNTFYKRRQTCSQKKSMHAVFIVSPAKHTWKEFEEVSEVSNTSPKARMWLFLMMRDGHAFFCFASHCSVFPTHRFRCGLSRGSGRILALCLRFCFCASLSALSYSFSSHFSAILTSRL